MTSKTRRTLRVLWACLTGWIPVTVWLTSGPPGGGPWFEDLNDAAEFCHDQSVICAQEDPHEVEVTFTQDDLDALKERRCSAAEWYGWRIERLTIPRRRLYEESTTAR